MITSTTGMPFRRHMFELIEAVAARFSTHSLRWTLEESDGAAFRVQFYLDDRPADVWYSGRLPLDRFSVEELGRQRDRIVDQLATLLATPDEVWSGTDPDSLFQFLVEQSNWLLRLSGGSSAGTRISCGIVALTLLETHPRFRVPDPDSDEHGRLHRWGIFYDSLLAPDRLRMEGKGNLHRRILEINHPRSPGFPKGTV